MVRNEEGQPHFAAPRGLVAECKHTNHMGLTLPLFLGNPFHKNILTSAASVIFTASW